MWGNFTTFEAFLLWLWFAIIPILIGGAIGFVLGKWVF
jgi:hypothetical protein